MCLCIDKKRTKRFKSRKRKEMWAYKVLSYGRYSWYSPFLFKPYPPKGIVKSRRKPYLTSVEISNQIVDYGIHVYLSRPDEINNFCTVFKVKVNIDDLIAIGYNNDAVFTKIYFDEANKL